MAKLPFVENILVAALVPLFQHITQLNSNVGIIGYIVYLLLDIYFLLGTYCY